MNLNHLCQLPKDKSPAIGCIGAGFIMRDCHLVSYKSNGFNSIAVAELDEGCRKELIEKHPDIPKQPHPRLSTCPVEPDSNP
tara:strand:- start:115 stop:360 length:246 start_codon:yes stop_codon:yes gene_type:complete